MRPSRTSPFRSTKRPARGARRLSSVLRSGFAGASGRIAIDDLARLFGDRAFGGLLFLFAFPNLAPLPPGVSSIFAAPLILVAGQLVVGRRDVWMPAVVGRRSLRAEYLRAAFARGIGPMRRAERLLAPRLEVLSSGVFRRVVGGLCLLLGLVLFLPIPFGNFLPALAVAALALGLLHRDGLAVTAGIVLSSRALPWSRPSPAEP